MNVTGIIKGIFGMNVKGLEARNQAKAELPAVMPLVDILEKINTPEMAKAKFYTEHGIEIAEVEFTGVIYTGDIAQWAVCTYTEDRKGYKASGYVVYDDSLIYINRSPARRVNHSYMS